MNTRIVSQLFKQSRRNSSSLKLGDGARVAVIGGGPAGSFFAYFLQTVSRRAGLDLQVDIYEPRDFDTPGPPGCNMCGGVLYESLVQSLAVEGINIPATVVQRGIDYNMLHMGIGSVKIKTPHQEKRIATIFRGIGPRGLVQFKGRSLDNFLMQSALALGARRIFGRVDQVKWLSDPKSPDVESKLIQVKTQGGDFRSYELLAVASGVNTAVLRLFSDLDFGYHPPQTSKLLVREYYLGEEVVSKYLGSVFHAFLLDIPGLDYGAVIPKGDYITICLLSSHGNLNPGAMEAFVENPAVKQTLPPDFSMAFQACNCSPRINLAGSTHPFSDRIVFVGDCGVSRLYKDGIGAAYRTAKIAACTAVFQGISEKDFKKQYLPFLRRMEMDNLIGKMLFKCVSQIQKKPFIERAVLRMVSREQQGKAKVEKGMSLLIWDMLTGGAPYRDALIRTLHPLFWTRFLWNILLSMISRTGSNSDPDLAVLTPPNDETASPFLGGDTVHVGDLGRLFQDGEIIVRQGEIGDCMYVIQDGVVEVIRAVDGQEVRVAQLGRNEFFGEMEVFDNQVRTATIRAVGFARVLSIDKKNLLNRIHEDPTLAYRMIQVLSSRVRDTGSDLVHLKLVPPKTDQRS